MRSWIELLCRSRDFKEIASRWPRAVRTPHGIVIPRFHRISPTLSITVEIRSGPKIVFRPAIEGRGSFESARRRVLRELESALDGPLTAEQVDTPFGAAALTEEWGDFAVTLQTGQCREDSHRLALRDITEPISAPS